jgi:uncharacterized membrane protein required for colicin V production
MLFNLVPLIFVLAFMVIGSKRGFVRELMGLVALGAALVITTGKLDFIAVEISNAVGTSPLTTAIISFVLVLGLTFAVFKLAAKLLYKLIEVQKLGQQDKYGGAIVGAVRGFLICGAVLLVTVLMPLPRAYYTLLDNSVLGTSSLRSVQYLYDLTDPLHSTWPSFLAQMEYTLTSPEVERAARGSRDRGSIEKRVRQEIATRNAVDKLYFYFGNEKDF